MPGPDKAMWIIHTIKACHRVVMPILALLLTAYLAAPARAQSLYNPRDPQFEARMRALNVSCMPEPFPIVTETYAYRFGASLADECVSQNTTKAQAFKYAALALTFLTPNPAAPAGLAYTAGELTSDGLKCVAKAFVEASTQLSPAQKESLKSTIGTVFTIKDWKSFASSIVDLRTPNNIVRTKAAVEAAAALYERGSEARGLKDAISEAIESGRRTISGYVLGEAQTDLDASDYAANSCRYAEAEKWLKQAQEAAPTECRAYGEEYRQAEVNLLSYIASHSGSLTDALTDPARITLGALNAQENTYVTLNNSLQERKRILGNFASIFARLTKEKEKLSRAKTGFWEAQQEYRFQVRLVRRAMNTPYVCADINRLSEMLAAVRLACRPAFFDLAGGESGAMATPDELALELSSLAREKWSRWWAMTDEIEREFRACGTSTAKAKLEALKAEVMGQRPSIVTGGQCQALDRTALLKRIEGLVTPVHCQERAVPEVRGLDPATATDRLYKAGLRPSNNTVTAPFSSEKRPGTVIDTNPAVGTMQKPLTEVTLTVAGAAPAEKQAAMPEVIGLDGSKAAERVSGAGLVPAVVEGEPADKRDRTPGAVYAASAAKGAALPVKTEVTLTVYGPRPIIVVAAVAGMTLEQAKGVLSAQNLSVGDPVAGEPATGERIPGNVYGTDPPQGSKLEMFSDVSILVYGPRSGEDKLRPVPSVIGQTVAGATGILVGADQFFQIGGVFLGDPAPAGKEPGTVYETKPTPETPAAKGTQVDLTVYGPRSSAAPPEHEPAARQETGEDGGWLGRWRLHGFVDQNGKRKEYTGMMEIALRADGLWQSLFTEKNGKLTPVATIPVKLAGPDIVVRMDVLQQRTASAERPRSGLLSAEFAQIFRRLLETLRISREGNLCTMSFSDETAKKKVIQIECRRDDGGSR